MGTKTKLLFTATLVLLFLGIVTGVNVSVNFHDYGLKSAIKRATMTATIVKDGLTAHMVNGIMDKRQYFLDQISNNNKEVKSLWIVRAPSVNKQFGKGLYSENIRDAIDKKVISKGKTIQSVQEHMDNTILRITIPYKATTMGNPNCLSCHDVKPGETLGAISMEFDITSMRNDGILTIVKIMSINLLFIVFILYIINKYTSPFLQLFQNIQDGITQAYSGNFSYTFQTTLKGDAKNTVNNLNTLFKKMQKTFDDIKSNLSTFILQDNFQQENPLDEAQIIIKELSDIYKFKKTIELDRNKLIIYERIANVLSVKYHIKEFALYEYEQQSNKRMLINKSEQYEDMCIDKVNQDITLCRAFRTHDTVISTDFDHLCKACIYKKDYVCIPFNINDEHSLVISLPLQSKDEIQQIISSLPSLTSYFEAAKPVLESRILTDRLKDSSLRDAMTGLYNRRFLEEFIDTIVASQARRENETYTILMLDIDFFKAVNDTYGHDIGDKVIIGIGKVLKESTRESDLAIRYGGEEFVVLLRNTNRENSLKVAQKIHQSFAQTSFDVGNAKSINKTLSIGIARFPDDAESIWQSIKYADTALYVAKTTGRNKIVEYSKELAENSKSQK